VIAVRFRARGRVQGVGYRAFVLRNAEHLHLGGWVRNAADGSVEGEAWGSDAAIATLLEALRRGPPQGRVTEFDHASIEPRQSGATFEIRRSG
jgi:acylphosphatase